MMKNKETTPSTLHLDTLKSAKGHKESLNLKDHISQKVENVLATEKESKQPQSAEYVLDTQKSPSQLEFTQKGKSNKSRPKKIVLQTMNETSQGNGVRMVKNTALMTVFAVSAGVIQTLILGGALTLPVLGMYAGIGAGVGILTSLLFRKKKK